MKLKYLDGATPLDPNEIDGLLASISTQEELNELEKANIKFGIEWAESSRRLRGEILTYSGLLKLHRALFGQVWRWAGMQRMSEKNIGLVPHAIGPEVGTLCADVRFWIDRGTYEWDEIGVRFHHRLVSIHPFVNGNGRHARIASDLLLTYHRQRPFTWGTGDLGNAGDVRENYIEALRIADAGEYRPLIRFARG